MNVILKAGIFCLNIIYSIMKLFPVKNKIVYISRQSDEVPVDFTLVKNYMQEHYPEFENVILVRTLKPGIIDKISYVFYMFKMMGHIATAKAVLLDTYCIPVSILKQRRELLVIQIWHALGAFKKFGYSILDKGEGTKSQFAEVMKMHANYSYVLTSSEYCRPYFAEAFHQNEEKVKVIPLPRVDILMNEKWRQDSISAIYRYYPQLREKKVIVYTPTFRKGKNELENAVREFVAKADYSEYEVVVKQHPLSDLKIEHTKAIVDTKFSTQEMLNVADYVVTDYSATMYEAALMGKPLFFYVFDFEDYTKNRDFYLDLSNMLPGYMSQDAGEILKAIKEEHYSIDVINDFANKMISLEEKTCTQRLCELILDELKNRR